MKFRVIYQRFWNGKAVLTGTEGILSGDGYGNPFIMLRLGECCLEIGDEKNAVEYLLRAYMMEGKEIFEPDEDGEDDGQKYFDFLKTHVDHIE